MADGFFGRPWWDAQDEAAHQAREGKPPLKILNTDWDETLMIETLDTRRTREHFEEAMTNADCPLFEAIARWVIQDYGYKNMDVLVRRIKQLEATERNAGIVSSFSPF